MNWIVFNKRAYKFKNSNINPGIILIFICFLSLSIQTPKTIKLRQGESIKINGLTIKVNDIVYESIAAAPHGLPAYSAGSGVSVHLQLKSKLKSKEIVLEELSKPYTSHSIEKWNNYQVSLIHFDDGQKMAELEVIYLNK